MFCLIFFKRLITKERKVFFLYTIIISILVVIGFSLLYVYESRESYFLAVRFYNVIEYSLLAYFFSIYIKNLFVKKALLASTILYLFFCVFSFFNQEEPEMPFVPFSVEHILLIIFIVYYFFEIMNESVIEPIYQKAIFWVSVAFIINSAGNFFLFLYSKTRFNDDVFKSQYTIIYTTVTVLKNLLLCISIFIKESPKSKSDQEIFEVDLDAYTPIKNTN